MTPISRDKTASNDTVPLRNTLRLWKTKLAKEMVMADSTGTELTGKAALLRALVLRRLLHKLLPDTSEVNVGLLMPPSVPTTLLNVALTMDLRVAINMNYTLSSDILNVCIAKAGIKHLITSRKVMSKFNFQPNCEVVYLEDHVKSIGLYDKLLSLYEARCLSLSALFRKYRLDQIDENDTLTILFTSGSTGNPKGVMLSHGNVGANIESCEKYFHLCSDDRMACVVPVFHSLGFMATMWACVSIGMRPIYHYSPLEYRTIAKLCRQYRPTIVVGTPSFLRLYARKFEPADFESVNQIMTGAERCPVALMDEIDRKFGLRPVQGYGITETSPVVAANLSKQRRLSEDDPMPNDEALGLPLPGVEVKILDVDTGQPCPQGKTGMIWVKGKSVMKGYYQEPDKTAEVIKDGWYKTGDLGYFDPNGYLMMSGRLSRFAKIGGEMVPHEGIEDNLNAIFGNSPEEPIKLCVTSVPDEHKGEKIIVLYTESDMTPKEINLKLIERGVPNIWIPAVDGYFKIDAVPLLGTGKLDLQAIHKKAMELTKTK